VELILAIVGAGPIGFFIAGRRRGLAAYLCLWAVVFPFQTVVVFSSSGDDNNALYWIFNALILGLGIGLNRLGAELGQRRRARLGAAQRAA
jgi:peptidoglycan/LPS O-acetylase OafA/YrhL